MRDHIKVEYDDVVWELVVDFTPPKKPPNVQDRNDPRWKDPGDPGDIRIITAKINDGPNLATYLSDEVYQTLLRKAWTAEVGW